MDQLLAGVLYGLGVVALICVAAMIIFAAYTEDGL